MVHFRTSYLKLAVLQILPVAALVAQTQSQVNLIRPGVIVKIVSAGIAQDGTITARATITDPAGMPLDRMGVNTAGTVSMSFIAARIPANQRQFVSYSTTTLKATLNNNPPQIQAANDSGGTFTKNAEGDYTYTFRTKAPAGFDRTATHAIGVSANRNLSGLIEQDEWAAVSNDVLTFVPNGAPVTVVRSVVSTDACNKCHNPLYAHGGSRLAVELCILCHTPQTVNPDTLHSQDMPVLIHKIHMGSKLPSVVNGTPYRIWHRGNWSDFSNVAFPQDIRNCNVCHTDGPEQADSWKTNPSRAVCGSCHDDVNFATGENHVDFPVFNDDACKVCHTSEVMWELDASIPGAHVIPNNSALLPGLVTKILSVEGAIPGAAPTVTFSVTDNAGNPVNISKLTQIRLVLAGPNTDYQTGTAGIRASENPAQAPGLNGVYKYTMTNKIPAGATGSYTVSLEARNSLTLYAGTKGETTATDSARPVQYYFSVDSSKVVPRRVVVSDEKCNACHKDLKFIHGGTRSSTQECAICHNPTLVDGTSKQSVNFSWMIHSIHRGESLENPYVLGNTNYQEVLFPGDLRDCASCHVNKSYLPDSVGAVAPVANTGGFLPTMSPISSACLGCHDGLAAAAHALINTSKFGENCLLCHAAGSTYSVDTAHSR